MYKHYALAMFCGALSACSVTLDPPESVATHAPEYSATASAPITPVRTVELSGRDDGSTRNCENLTRPGSRIVVAQRCRPVDEEALADQLNQVRREQDELDRLAREREAQRRGF